MNSVFPFSLNLLTSDILITNLDNVQIVAVSGSGNTLLVTISYSKTIEG
jgi:hypothetical protein